MKWLNLEPQDTVDKTMPVDKYKPTILSDQLQADLKQHRANLVAGMAEIEAAEQCGVECQQHRIDYGNALDKIDALLTNFGTKPRFNVGQ